MMRGDIKTEFWVPEKLFVYAECDFHLTVYRLENKSSVGFPRI